MCEAKVVNKRGKVMKGISITLFIVLLILASTMLMYQPQYQQVEFAKTGPRPVPQNLEDLSQRDAAMIFNSSQELTDEQTRMLVQILTAQNGA